VDQGLDVAKGRLPEQELGSVPDHPPVEDPEAINRAGASSELPAQAPVGGPATVPKDGPPQVGAAEPAHPAPPNGPGARGVGPNPRGGPSTPEGKAEVAQHALKHGGYAKHTAYIRRGAFREDPEEVGTFEDAVVTLLAPHNELEECAARGVARAMTNSVRFDRFLTHVLSLRSTVNIIDPQLLPNPALGSNPLHDDPLIVLDAFVTEDSFLRKVALSEAAPDLPHVRWQDIACLVLSRLEPEHPLIQEGAARLSQSQWRATLEQVLRAHFDAPPKAKQWVRAWMHATGVTFNLNLATDVAAENALKALDEAIRTGARVTGEVMARLKSYRMLQNTLERIEARGKDK